MKATRLLLIGLFCWLGATGAKAQVEAPVITFEPHQGYTTFKITGLTNAQIWFNYHGSNSTDDSMPYFKNEEYRLEAPADVTAFVRLNDEQSETVTKHIVVNVDELRLDRMFDLNIGDYILPDEADKALFSWGNTSQTGVNEEVTLDNLVAISKGQAVWLTYSDNKTTMNNTDPSYRPQRALDEVLFAQTEQTLHKGQIVFGRSLNEENDYACLQTKGKYMGPIDIVTLYGGTDVLLTVETSTDGTTWQVEGTQDEPSYNHDWKFNRTRCNFFDERYVRVRLGDVGNGSSQVSPSLFGLYILQRGERSLTREEECKAEYQAWLTGISSVSSQPTISQRYYSLDGRALEGKPTRKGVYVNGGRKVVVK